jgi:hypothetical protein
MARLEGARMQGPDTPDVLLKASDRISRSRIWNMVHRQETAVVENDGGDDLEEATPFTVRLGVRGTPVAAPRRARR